MPHWFIWGALAPFIFVVDRRWLGRLRPFSRIVAHVPLGLAVSLLAISLSYWTQQALGVQWLPDSAGTFFLQQSFGAATTYALIVGVSVAIGYAGEAQKREQEAVRLALHSAQLETHLAQARLRLLHSQLNPHFPKPIPAPHGL